MREPPRLVLAADHRARGVRTVERYATMKHSLAVALQWCDGILATYQPLADLRVEGHIKDGHQTYLSINRTGLATSAFELDDRLVATVVGAAASGWTGIKMMTRIDVSDPLTAPALELLGRVLEECRTARLEALIEPLTWSEGTMAKDTESIIFAAMIAFDMGAPLLKVPVPDAAPGPPRKAAIERIVGSVGAPVLFLGGPRGESTGSRVLDEARDVIDGGGHGMAIGRTIYQDPNPGDMAKRLRDIVG